MVCPACGHVDVPVEQSALVLLAGVSTALPTGCLLSGRGPPGLGSWRTLRRRRGRVEARGRKKEAYGAAGDRAPGADAEVLGANAYAVGANASDCAADDGAAFFGANAIDGASADVLCANALDGDASADVLGADAEVFGANALVVGANASDCAADDGAAFFGANAFDGASADVLCASAFDGAADDGENASDGACADVVGAIALDDGASSLGANAVLGANSSDAKVDVPVVQCASVLLAGVSTAMPTGCHSSFLVEWDSRKQTQYGSDRQLLK